MGRAPRPVARPRSLTVRGQGPLFVFFRSEASAGAATHVPALAAQGIEKGLGRRAHRDRSECGAWKSPVRVSGCANF
jgi:hypothetical protein